MALTDEQRAQYEERGYLLVRGLFGEAELEPWRVRLAEIVRGDQQPSDGMLVMRDVVVAKKVVQTTSPEQAVAKLQDFEHDPVLGGYIERPELLDWVEAFVGPDIASIHSMLINKPPGLDSRHPLHQDLVYFPFRPADRIVATWTALEPCFRDNGCLAVVPGSHRDGLREHENPDWEHLNFGYFGAKGVGADTDRVHVEMAPGDTLFFHPLLLHGSGRNRSQAFRRAISAHYASASCRYLNPDLPPGRPYRLVRGRDDADGIVG